MEIVFYNRTGRPVAYTENNTDIYLYSGELVAYLEGDSVYACSGRHLGWFVDGWILDHDGNHVFFSDIATDGPARPTKQASPGKAVRRSRPIKGPRKPGPPYPGLNSAWSHHASEEFFTNRP
jgi:hypothetical protein